MSRTLEGLEAVLRQRRADAPSGSYSVSLFQDHERLLRKIMEEAFELCLELGRAEPDHGRVVAEAADLTYHVLAGLVAREVSFEEVLSELDRRSKP